MRPASENRFRELILKNKAPVSRQTLKLRLYEAGLLESGLPLNGSPSPVEHVLYRASALRTRVIWPVADGAPLVRCQNPFDDAATPARSNRHAIAAGLKRLFLRQPRLDWRDDRCPILDRLGRVQQQVLPEAGADPLAVVATDGDRTGGLRTRPHEATQIPGCTSPAWRGCRSPCTLPGEASKLAQQHVREPRGFGLVSSRDLRPPSQLFQLAPGV